jgi:hypothetical protein
MQASWWFCQISHHLLGRGIGRVSRVCLGDENASGHHLDPGHVAALTGVMNGEQHTPRRRLTSEPVGEHRAIDGLLTGLGGNCLEVVGLQTFDDKSEQCGQR